jgi:hypothetical protein
VQTQGPFFDLVLEATSRLCEHRLGDFDPVHDAGRSDLVEKRRKARSATKANLGDGAAIPRFGRFDCGENDGPVATVEYSPNDLPDEARRSTKLPRQAREDALPNRHTAT